MNYQNKISADYITELRPDEVFVFGSNLSGLHAGGAAKMAHQKFGAQWGVGEGMTGQCYAFPTVYYELERSLTLDEISDCVQRFLEVVKTNPQKKFLLTKVGCAIAGFTPEQIAPLFERAIDIENIYIPQEFYDVIFFLTGQYF